MTTDSVSPFLTTNVTSMGTGGAPVVIQSEISTTHAKVSNFFALNISAIYNILTRPVNSDGTSSPPITQDDADAIQGVFSNLYLLAQGGLTTNIQTNAAGYTQRYFLTDHMVQALDLIVRSFQATGATDPNISITMDQLQQWKDFTLLTPEIQKAFAAAFQATTMTRSLQSIIEMDYVDAGNSLIVDKLGTLETALKTTQGVLDLLANIQNAKNNVTTIQRSQNNIPFSVNTNIAAVQQSWLQTVAIPEITAAGGNYPTSLGAYYNGTLTGVSHTIPFDGYESGTTEHNIREYEKFFKGYNSYYFNSPQFPVPPDSLLTYYDQAGKGTTALTNTPYEVNLYPISVTAAGLSLFNKILSYKAQLSAFIPKLLQSLGSAAADPNSLYNRAKAVLTSLNNQFVGGRRYDGGVLNGTGTVPNVIAAENIVNAGDKAMALFRWLTDTPEVNSDVKIPDNAAAAGDTQTSLTSAITSAENLNDTQKENVRNFLFVFEEFYKSASAALQRISQMIEKMAGNISR